MYCINTASAELIAIVTVSVVIVAGILIAVIIVVIVIATFSQKSKLKSPALVTTATNDNHDDHEMAFGQTDTEKSDTMY